MANRVAIVSAVRTPFTRALKGELKDTRPDTLLAMVIKEAVDSSAGWKTPQLTGTQRLTKEGKVNLGKVIFSAAPVPEIEDDEDEE